MKKEYKRVKKLSKKILPKEQYKKIKKIPNYVERTEGLKYLLASQVKLKLLELELKSREISKKESMIIEAQLSQLRSKIKIFESTHEKSDYEALQKIIKKIENEIKCLTS